MNMRIGFLRCLAIAALYLLMALLVVPVLISFIVTQLGFMTADWAKDTIDGLKSPTAVMGRSVAL